MSEAIVEFIPSDLNKMLVLDIGCAKGHLGYQIRTKKSGTLAVLGLDLWAPYIKEVRSFHLAYARIYDDLILGDARYMPFRDKVFNLLIASEILEHLPREDGFRLLKEMERICKDRIITSTPSKFFEQEELNDNPHQRHVSHWKEEDFVKSGYEVKVVYGKSLNLVEKIGLITRLSEPLGVILAWKTVQGV